MVLADFACRVELWWVERSPYCDTWDDLEGLLIRFADWVFDGLDAEVALARPPIVSIDSALSSSVQSSGPESSSNIVFLLAGGGRAANESGFLVILRPYDNVDMEAVMISLGNR